MGRMNAPERRTLEGNGLPLALWDYGGDGPPVLFLHGFLDTGRSFEDLAFGLRGRCRALCLDWRGHGASGWVGAGGAYHQLDHLKDLVAVLQALRTEGQAPVAVVAHSMGGIVALQLAASRPEFISRLLLLDCIGGYSADADTQIDQLGQVVDSVCVPKRPFRSFPGRAEAEARIRHNNPGLTDEGAERIARHYFEAAEDGTLTARLDPRLRGPNPYRFPEGHWQRICARTSVPVAVLAPETGYCRRIEALRERYTCFPDATWQDLDGVSHHVHVEAVDTVVEALVALLARPTRT